MSLLDHEFKTLCQRTDQAERRIARHQELVATKRQRGEAVEAETGFLVVLQTTLQQLRAQRSEMARQLRYRARRRTH
jgi:hypothetical protein